MTLATVSSMLLAVGCGTGEVRQTSTDATGVASTPISEQSTTPFPSPSPIPGLTDTGYLAVDGSPLYAECIGIDPLTGTTFPLPPTYPTPTDSTPEPAPTSPVQPEITPDPADLPSFEFDAVPPADSAGWIETQSECFGLSALIPTSWEIAPGSFEAGWYQQATGATFTAPGLEVSLSYRYLPHYDAAAPIDTPGQSFGNAGYLLIKNRPVDLLSGSGYMNLIYDAIPAVPYLQLTYAVEVKPDWYLHLTAAFTQPYNEERFAEVKAFADKVQVQ